jgi:hypothetical protein
MDSNSRFTKIKQTNFLLKYATNTKKYIRWSQIAIGAIQGAEYYRAEAKRQDHFVQIII